MPFSRGPEGDVLGIESMMPFLRQGDCVLLQHSPLDTIFGNECREVTGQLLIQIGEFIAKLFPQIFAV
ncbi:MAG: hypothetical protein CMO80_02115 [Verrucomicrobiales bacterium]|nr:hypothetical protein [Verrucomicrobiales bacterium]